MHYANETKDTFGHYLTCKLDKIIYNGLKLTETPGPSWVITEGEEELCGSKPVDVGGMLGGA